LDTFGAELGIEFKHQLEGGHVINQEQVKVLTLGKGVNGTNLDFSFRNKDSFNFKAMLELGETFC